MKKISLPNFLLWRPESTVKAMFLCFYCHIKVEHCLFFKAFVMHLPPYFCRIWNAWLCLCVCAHTLLQSIQCQMLLITMQVKLTLTWVGGRCFMCSLTDLCFWRVITPCNPSRLKPSLPWATLVTYVGLLVFWQIYPSRQDDLTAHAPAYALHFFTLLSIMVNSTHNSMLLSHKT